jgi:hypothetical protein
MVQNIALTLNSIDWLKIHYLIGIYEFGIKSKILKRLTLRVTVTSMTLDAP